MSDTPGTKAELLERIRSSYAALNALVLQLSTAQLTQPIDTTWSVKDMLAHITAWEQIMLHFHIGKRPFEQVTQLGNIGYTALNVDELNEALFQRDQA
ncbi:MAG TPA: ClbS/DfsB family four-helix bundle protein, partial [Kouleothrix sp.]|nr:ClbS/DfsB family four-helix bundle protein [Kouleothrix sp.]